MFGRIILLFVMAGTSLADAQIPEHPQNMIPVVDGWKFIRADVNGAEATAFDDRGTDADFVEKFSKVGEITDHSNASRNRARVGNNAICRRRGVIAPRGRNPP